MRGRRAGRLGVQRACTGWSVSTEAVFVGPGRRTVCGPWLSGLSVAAERQGTLSRAVVDPDDSRRTLLRFCRLEASNCHIGGLR